MLLSARCDQPCGFFVENLCANLNKLCPAGQKMLAAVAGPIARGMFRHGGATAKLPRSSGPFVEDFSQNGRKCPLGIM